MPDRFDVVPSELDSRSTEELLRLISDEDEGWKPEALDRVLGMGLPAICNILENAVRNDADADLRNGAMEVFVAYGRESIPHLIRLLQDDDHEVRNFGAVMLGEIGSRDAVPNLIKALHDPDPNVSHAAAEALGRIGDRSALVPLSSLLKGDFWLQYPAIVAIGEMRDNRAVPVLLEILSINPMLTAPVVEALGKISDERALPTLGEILSTADGDLVASLAVAIDSIYRNSGEDCRFRSVIVEPLEHSGIAEIVSAEGAARLRDLLRDAPQSGGGAAAARILGWLEDTTALPLLFRMVENGGGSETVQQAIMSMGTKAVTALQGEIFNECGIVRALAVRLLRWLNAPLDQESLGRLAADADPQVRVEALESLRGVTAPWVLPLLKERLAEPDSLIVSEGLKVLSEFPRETILSFLGELAAGAEGRLLLPRLAAMSPTAVSAGDLVPCIRDADTGVRAEAIHAAGVARYAELIPAITVSLGDETAEVREEAVNALGEFGSQAPLADLLPLLGTGDSRFRYAVVKALGKTASPEAGSALAAYLANGDHPRPLEYAILESLAKTGAPGSGCAGIVHRYFAHQDPDIRRLAVAAYAGIAGKGAAPQLEEASRDGHWSVRIAALTALAQICSEEALPAVVAALGDPDLLVRKNAVMILGSLRSVRGVSDLVLQLTDPELGRLAFEALLKIGKSGLPILHRYLRANYQLETRERVIDLIGKIADRRSIDPLLDVLSDPNPAIRLAAIDSLVFCFDSVPLRKLMLLKNRDMDEGVRKKADLALRILTLEKFL